MIAVVIRECTYLKVLHPIMEEFNKMGQKYVVYHWDAPRGQKEYNRASLKNIMASSGDVLKGAKKIKAFTSDKQLLKMFQHDGIKKLVSLEIWQWAKQYIKAFKTMNIKSYSIRYLMDGIFDPAACIKSIYRTYYSTPFLMRKHHKYAGISYDPNRDKCLGSPVFDCIGKNLSENKTLVLLPNIGPEYVKAAFGNVDRLNNIIRKVCVKDIPIFKARKKQWIPPVVKEVGGKVIFDGEKMYPPMTSKLFTKSFTIVMFWSSGVFEAIYSGNYVINIEIPLARWSWNAEKMKDCFYTKGLYSFKGVIETRTQGEILTADFIPRKIDPNAQKEWLERFISPVKNGAGNIAKDIISS